MELIVKGVEDVKQMTFNPFSRYMRKQVAAPVNLCVGMRHGVMVCVSNLFSNQYFNISIN